MNIMIDDNDSRELTPAILEVVTATAENSRKTAVIGKPFQPGQSGNMGGRPKAAQEFKDLARSKSIEALERVAAIVNDPMAKNADIIAGARLLIERGFGSPVQDVMVGKREEEEPPAYDISKMTTQEKITLIGLIDKASGNLPATEE